MLAGCVQHVAHYNQFKAMEDMGFDSPKGTMGFRREHPQMQSMRHFAWPWYTARQHGKPVSGARAQGP